MMFITLHPHFTRLNLTKTKKKLNLFDSKNKHFERKYNEKLIGAESAQFQNIMFFFLLVHLCSATAVVTSSPSLVKYNSGMRKARFLQFAKPFFASSRANSKASL